MLVKSGKLFWKKQLILLLAFVVAASGLPAVLAPQAAKASDVDPIGSVVGPGGVGTGLISWVDMNKSIHSDNVSGGKVEKLVDLTPSSNGRVWNNYSNRMVDYAMSESVINFNRGILNGAQYSVPQFANPNPAGEIFSVQAASTPPATLTGFPFELGGNYNDTSVNKAANFEGGTSSKLVTYMGSGTKREVPSGNLNVDLTKPNIMNVWSTATNTPTDGWGLSLNGKASLHEPTNSVSFSSAASGSAYYIGAAHSVRFWGEISELIFYDHKLGFTERLKVDSYLALKYGITLKDTDGNAVDYIASDSEDGVDGIEGTRMWTAAHNVGYGNRITGIGRDDASGLEQKQSKSQAEGALVTFSLGNTVEVSNEKNGNATGKTITSDKSFFTFSDDNEAATYEMSTIEEPGTGHKLKRLERIFKVEETNWTPTDVTLKLDVTQDQNAPVHNYYLLTSDDGITFTQPTEAHKLNTDYEVTINSSQLKNYFTFAKVFKEDLKALVDGLKTFDEDHYTSISWGAFDSAKTNANTVLGNGDASQEEVDDARDTLQAGVDGLTLKVPVTATLDAAAKTITIPFEYDVTLNASNIKDGFAVKIGETLLDIDNIEVGSDAKSIKIILASDSQIGNVSQVTVEYTQTNDNVKGPFDKAVGNIVLVAEDSYAAALTIDQPSGTTGSEHQPTFSGDVEDGSTVSIVIKDKDGNLVVNAGGIATVDGGNWTFEPSVELQNGNYTIEVTATKAGQTATKTKSFAVVDKTELQTKVNEANALKEADFTPESWAALQPKLKVAQDVLVSTNTTPESVADALTDLEAAIGALVKKSPKLVAAELSGKEITLTFDQTVTADSAAGLTIAVGGETVTLTDADVIVDPDDNTKVIVTLPENPNGQKVLVSYDPGIGGFKGTNGKPVEEFTDKEAVDPFTAAFTIDQPSGTTVSESQPTIAGKVEAGSTVTIVIKDKDGNLVENAGGTATLDGENWTFEPSVELMDGDYTIEVTATKGSKTVTISKDLKVDTVDQSKLTGLELKSWKGTSIRLSPIFNGGLTYTATVTNTVYSVTVIPTPLDPDANIRVRVNNGDWQAASDELLLDVGSNTIVVEVTDTNGHITKYTLTVTRKSNSGGDSPGGTGGGNGDGSTTTPTTPTTPVTPETPKPEESGIETSVNGKDNTFASGTTSTLGDRNITSVQVDLDKLNEAVSQGSGQNLRIHSPNEGDVKVDGLTAEAVKQLAGKGASLEISNPLAIYPVPGGKMDLSGVSGQFGNAALGDITVHIDIVRSSDTLINNAKNKAAAEGYELLVTPVDLNLTFSHDGKTVRSDQLNGYAPKYIALPEGIDPNRITTGVIVNPDGSVFHVPTVVTKIDNRYYALINDLHSSGSYSVIWNPQDFDDVKGHWGRTDVNNIAARLDLAGTGNNTFSPDRNVTRSEFSEIVVAGLGLMRQNAPENLFPDVPTSTWYRNSVAIATEFEIVRGYDDGNFYGDRQITREQGMAMIARAYNLIEPKAALSEERIASLLANYEDAASVSAWARANVARLIEAGIVQGNGPLLLSPQANMTRAEVTALIARLLITTNLIDK